MTLFIAIHTLLTSSKKILSRYLYFTYDVLVSLWVNRITLTLKISFSRFQHVKRQVMLGKENLMKIGLDLVITLEEKNSDLSVPLAFFREDCKSTTMTKHGMHVVKEALSQLNNQQTPVIAFDQSLSAISN